MTPPPSESEREELTFRSFMNARVVTTSDEHGRTLAPSPFKHNDWHLIELELPIGASEFRSKFYIRTVRDVTIEQTRLSAHIRRVRWNHDVERVGKVIDVKAPWIVCATKQKIFPAICAFCGEKLVINDHDGDGGRMVNPDEPFEELATCSQCEAGRERKYSCAQPSAPRAVKFESFSDLIADWGTRVGGEDPIINDANVAARFDTNFPCWRCDLRRECYNSDNTRIRAARHRLRPVHWSALPLILFPSPLIRFEDYPRELEEAALDRMEGGDPSIVTSLLFLLEQKTRLLRKLAQALVDAQERVGAPLGGLDMNFIAITTGDFNDINVVLLDSGIVVQTERVAGLGNPNAYSADSILGPGTKLPSFSFRASLSRIKMQLQQTESATSVNFLGKLEFTPSRLEDDEAAILADFATQDLCTISQLPDEVGVAGFHVKLSAKTAQPGALLFRAPSLLLKHSLVERFRRETARRVDNVIVHFTKIPGYDADQRSLAKIALSIIINYNSAAADSAAPLANRLVDERKARPGVSTQNLLEALRVPGAAPAPGIDNISDAIHPLRILGSASAGMRRRGLDPANFDMKLWDELLGAIINWLALPRRDIDADAVVNIFQHLQSIERRVRLFRAIRNVKILQYLNENNFSREATEDPSERSAPTPDLDRVLDILTKVAARARAANDLQIIRDLFKKELDGAGFTVKDAVTALHIIQFPRGRDYDPSILTSTPPGPTPPPTPITTNTTIPVDRHGLAFVPLYLQMGCASREEAIQRAGQLIQSKEAFANWSNLLKLSIYYIDFLRKQSPASWPVVCDREAAERLLDGLRSEEDYSSLVNATLLLDYFKNIIRSYHAAAAEAVVEWGRRNAIDNLLKGAGTPANRGSWSWLNKISAGENSPNISFHDRLAKDLQEEIRRRTSAVLTTLREPAPNQQIESSLRSATPENLEIPREFARLLEAPIIELLKRTGSVTTDAPDRAARVLDQPRRLLAFVVTSQIGAELLHWRMSLPAGSLGTEGSRVDAEFYRSIAAASAFGKTGSLNALEKVPRTVRAFVNLYSNPNSDAMNDWLASRTLPAVMEKIDKSVPSGFLNIMKRSNDLWTQFTQLQQDGEFSGKRLVSGFNEQLLLQAENEAAR